MRCASSIVLALAALVAACGGGNSSETTITGAGIAGGGGVQLAELIQPTGTNTAEIVVDSGPAGAFSLGAANIPYVTVSVCAPASANCVSIDHVILDTGSIGLRVMRSAVAALGLPAVSVPADAAHSTPAGAAVECYPFVLGAVWGPLASADVQVAGEVAPAIPIQLIDDRTPAAPAAPADCLASAEGSLLNSVAALQANGILGIGMLAYDCGHGCVTGDYSAGHVLYYACPAGSACTPAAVPAALQMQNPVAHFAVDNNGTLITMPALPDLGAVVARGRLVFGIGTQANNQIPPTARMVSVDADTASPTYLYFTTSVASASYPYSYIDSGSNALFFDDTTLSRTCQSSGGSQGGWYCPAAVERRTATITDAPGNTAQVDFAIASADLLFRTSSTAFDDLGGSSGQSAGSFVWGMSFFYGRSVFTSIWGQALSPNGPWNAF